jgi:hypothetical protein
MSNICKRPPYQKQLKGKRNKKKQSPAEAEDKTFRAWLRTQPSAYSGMSPCIAAHYRTAANSGTGTKPLFSAIPLTVGEHNRQHQIGQYTFMPREWWEEKVAYYLERWKKQQELTGL